MTSSQNSKDESSLIDELRALAINAKKSEKLKVRGKTFPVWGHEDLSIEGWKFNEWDFYKKGNYMPIRARGLFTIGDKIVLRGFDKFFNIGENENSWKSILEETSGPYYVTVKENGCLVLIGGYDGKLVVTSKNSSGPRGTLEEDHEKNHSLVARNWVLNHLKSVGKTEEELARVLEKDNITALGELCDDDFEQHVISYDQEAAGIYLVGLNENTPNFTSLEPAKVQEFAARFGFRRMEFEQFDDPGKMKLYLDECAVTGTWNGKLVEGFVIRTHRKEDNSTYFFKFKFEEPYLMYRQWRTIAKQYAASPTSVIRPSGKHKESSLKFLEFIRGYCRAHPELLKAVATSQKGHIELRKAFIASSQMSEEELLALSVDDIPKWALVTVATLGCGKSTVAIALQLLMGWAHIQNDSLTGKNKPLKLVQNAISLLENNDVVIIDRNNPTIREREQLFTDMAEWTAPLGYNLKHVCLNFLPHGPTKNSKNLTRDRVSLRGDNHQTIRDMPENTVKGIMKGFESRFVPVVPTREPDSNFDLVIDLEVSKNGSRKNVKTILKALAAKYPELKIVMPSEQRIDECVKAALEHKAILPKELTEAKTKKKIPKVAYFGLDVSSSPELKECLDENLNTAAVKFNPLNDLHVTIAHIKSHKQLHAAMTQAHDSHLRNASKQNARIVLPEEDTVTLLSFCYNDRVAAFRVKCASTASANEHPHMTVGLIKGASAVESNDMLAKEHHEVVLSPPLEIPARLYAQF